MSDICPLPPMRSHYRFGRPATEGRDAVIDSYLSLYKNYHFYWQMGRDGVPRAVTRCMGVGKRKKDSYNMNVIDACRFSRTGRAGADGLPLCGHGRRWSRR